MLSIINYFGFIETNIDPLINKRYIILNKNNISYHDENTLNYINNNTLLMNKKLITISPSGFYGFYVMGVCAYIKENYDISEFIFSGASAGSLNSIFMIFKKNPKLITDIIINNDLFKNKNAKQVLEQIKNNLLENFNIDDFDLDRLFISITTFHQTNIHTDFENLEDVLDCCIASSNVPFISGSLLHNYRNNYAFDGGFSDNPYLNTNQIALHIHPNIWGQNEKILFNLFRTNYFNIEKLYEKGYQDTQKYGKEFLDQKLINN